ncbi:hypothetical protein D7Y09_05720 [bacterium 1XD42-1]|nr:hypothetical protein D7Y09_05720 [bacterium 1XD42-1]
MAASNFWNFVIILDFSFSISRKLFSLEMEIISYFLCTKIYLCTKNYNIFYTDMQLFLAFY